MKTAPKPQPIEVIPDPAQAENPVTLRAVCIGMTCSILLNLVLLYSDFYLSNTFLSSNHFPVASIAVLLGAVLLVNTMARAWFKSAGLLPGELLLIWGMIGVAGGIGAAGFMRYLPAWLVAPAYLATPSNNFQDQLLAYIPNWMVVTHDSKDTAAKWFFEGLPAGAHIPWAKWFIPLGAWFAFGLCLYAAVFALTSLFFQQWSSRERLVFALVHLPSEMVREPDKGKLLNRFFRNPLTWVGMAVPFAHNLVNGLHKYFPAVPSIPFAWSGHWFPDRPWSELDMGALILYYSIVGLAFLLTTEMSFSIWFFYFLFRLSFVFIAWLGSGATGFWGDWGNQVGTFQAAGAVMTLAFFLFWTARKFLGEWFQRVLKGTSDRESDPLSPRLAFFLIVGGFTGMTAWFMLAGTSWWVALLGVGIFLSVVLVLTRIVAEAGILYVGTNVAALNLITGLFPVAWLSGATITALVMQNGILMADTQCILMPYLMNGVKACHQVRMRAGKVLAVFALTAVVALVVAAYGHITTNYKYGGANLDKLGSVWTPQWSLPGGINTMKNPPAYDFVQVGNAKLLPQKGAHVLVGVLLTAGMLIMRARFLWWPLHPLGLVICTQIAMLWIWFPIFLGWLAKTCVMSFGGASAYKKILPLFLGMVLGEYLAAMLWVVVSWVVGSPGYSILMHW